MSAPNPTDATNPPYNSLSRSSRPSHAIIGGISVSLHGTPFLSGQKSPVHYLLAHRALAETVDITPWPCIRAYSHCRYHSPHLNAPCHWHHPPHLLRIAFDSLRCFLIGNRHAILTHCSRTCSNTPAPTFATFERPFSPPSSFSLPTTFVSSLLKHSYYTTCVSTSGPSITLVCSVASMELRIETSAHFHAQRHLHCTSPLIRDFFTSSPNPPLHYLSSRFRSANPCRPHIISSGTFSTISSGTSLHKMSKLYKTDLLTFCPPGLHFVTF
jgi:hypothetical protein